MPVDVAIATYTNHPSILSTNVLTFTHINYSFYLVTKGNLQNVIGNIVLPMVH